MSEDTNHSRVDATIDLSADEVVMGAIEFLMTTDSAVAQREQLDAVVAAADRVRAWLDAIDVAVARRAKQLAAAATLPLQPDPSSGGDPSGPTGAGGAGAGSAAGGSHQPTLTGRTEAAELLSGGGHRSRRAAHAAASRAEMCDRLPRFEAALLAGEIAAGHLDVLATLTRPLSTADRAAVDSAEDELLDLARHAGVDHFRRQAKALIAQYTSTDDGTERLRSQRARNRVNRWVDDDSGMFKLFAEMDPETGSKVFAAFDAKVAAIKNRPRPTEESFEQLTVTALCELVTHSGPAGGHPEADHADRRDPDIRRVPEICVHIDARTLAHGLHPHSVCETADGTPLPPRTVQRLGCDAEVLAIFFDDRDRPVRTGRAHRTANAEQRRMLRALYRTCGFPDCTTPFDLCQIHHPDPWHRSKITDHHELLPLCTTHHRLVHEGGWRLDLDEQRRVTTHRPDGSLHRRVVTAERGSDQSGTRASRYAAKPASVASAG